MLGRTQPTQENKRSRMNIQEEVSLAERVKEKWGKKGENTCERNSLYKDWA